MYRLDNSKYPTTDQGLSALMTQPTDPTIKHWKAGGYLDRLSKDPWGNDYQYVIPARTAGTMTCSPSAPTASRVARASMPTSATGTSATRRPPPRARAPAAGFTLIEILVVVVIIGILCAAIMLSLNTSGRDQELEKESDRLVALFNYAREQAELQTREFGVMFADDGYEFLTYDNRRAEWRGVFEDDALAARKLPYGLTVALSVESRPWPSAAQGLQGQDAAGDDLFQRRPHELRRDAAARCGPAQRHPHPGREGRGDREADARGEAAMRSARGFTLIEVLVALVIVAIGMAAVMGALTSSASTVSYLRDKTFAQWAALNQIATIRISGQQPPTGNSDGDIDYAGASWHYHRKW